MEKNLLRMLELADRCFGAERDPDQLSVDEAVRARLRQLHPATLGEVRDGDGPFAWTLVIPTTRSLMEAFLGGGITERGLFEATPEAGPYQVVYLCAALVLPEHRRQGLARRLLCGSVDAIRAGHPITDLFSWAFSPEGERLSRAVAADLHLPLRLRARTGADDLPA